MNIGNIGSLHIGGYFLKDIPCEYHIILSTIIPFSPQDTFCGGRYPELQPERLVIGSFILKKEIFDSSTIDYFKDLHYTDRIVGCQYCRDIVISRFKENEEQCYFEFKSVRY